VQAAAGLAFQLSLLIQEDLRFRCQLPQFAGTQPLRDPLLKSGSGEHWTLLKNVGALASLKLSEFIYARQVRVGSVCGDRLTLRFQVQPERQY